MSVIPPPPPMQRPPSSPWKWILLGCGGLGCVAVIAIVVGVFAIMRSPIGQQATKAAFEMQSAQQQLMAVGQAIDRFAADKKKYPDRLEQLVPTYLPSEKSLHLNGVAGSPPIEYSKPPENAEGSTFMLQTHVSPPVPFPNAPPWVIRLTKDGRVVPAEYEYTDPSGKVHRTGRGRF